MVSPSPGNSEDKPSHTCCVWLRAQLCVTNDKSAVCMAFCNPASTQEKEGPGSAEARLQALGPWEFGGDTALVLRCLWQLEAEDVVDPRCEDHICVVTTPVSPEFYSSVYWIAVCLLCGWILLVFWHGSEFSTLCTWDWIVNHFCDTNSNQPLNLPCWSFDVVAGSVVSLWP